jgi:hypothetical protein
VSKLRTGVGKKKVEEGREIDVIFIDKRDEMKWNVEEMQTNVAPCAAPSS